MKISFGEVNPTSRPEENINVLAANVRSLRGKISNLTNYLQSLNFLIHIVVLNETWLSAHETYLYNLPNYAAHHSTRKKRGGGVSIYILNEFSDSNKTESFEYENANFLSVEITRFNFKVTSSYYPPGENFNMFIAEFDKFLERNENSIFFGDLNTDFFKPRSGQTKKLLQTFKINNQVILNSKSSYMFTRKNSANNENTCIDYFASDWLE